MSKTTFERAVEPRAAEPEPHTPGPLVRHGVMVRDTTETVGGMFCIRPGKMIVNHAGRTVPQYGSAIAYAYSCADAELFAAAPDMLAALRLIAETPKHGEPDPSDPAYKQDWKDSGVEVPVDALHSLIEIARAAISAAEGRR